MLTTPPRAPLRPFVSTLWASDDISMGPPTATRERILPTGEMHLAIRTRGEPFRYFEDDEDPLGWSLGHAVVGGARIGPYLKDISSPSPSVGAQLRAGVSELMFGVPAVELTGAHVPLDALWGSFSIELQERLAAEGSAERRLRVFEAALAERLPRARGLHPAVAHALGRFRVGARIGDVVRETGYSHRRLIDLFRHSVGLGPKLFCRVRRFHHAFARLTDPAASAGRVALEVGYSDQSHMIHDFRDFAGITPGEYQRLQPRRPGHVTSGS